MKQKIALIDSGIGGLTLFSKLIYYTDLTYVADNKFFPYGLKKESMLINIIDRLLFYFLYNNYNRVILACNTASYIYEKYLRSQYNNFVLTILDNTINELENYQGVKHVGILATNKVIDSKIYENLIKKKYQHKVTSVSASDLVNLCENNEKELIRKYIKENLKIFKEVDILILACTHFNIIEQEILDIFNIPVICSGYSLIGKIKNDLYSKYENSVIYLTNYYEDYVKKIRMMFNYLNNINIESLNI